MAIKDAVTTIVNRNAFYRDGYRLLLRISIVQGLIILLLVGGLVAIVMSMETKHVYFATTSDGRIINIVPLNEPYRSEAEVVTWVSATVQNTMRLDYRTYRQRLQEVSTNFTTTGWESFTKALKEARILEAMEARRLLITLDIKGAPEIKRQYVREGVYTWLITVPISIKFEGSEAPSTTNALLTLQIVRVSTLQNPDGISIEQWVARPL